MYVLKLKEDAKKNKVSIYITIFFNEAGERGEEGRESTEMFLFWWQSK